MPMVSKICSFVLLCLPLAALPAHAVPELSPQATYEAWSLYSFTENGNPVCYLASRVMDSTATVPHRAASYVLITNRPAEGRKGVISVVAGYSYQEASPVVLAIGRKQFHLFPESDTAWAENTADPQIVAAIHIGTKMTVTGQPNGGPETVDTYSLKGAAPALAALDQACPVAGQPSPPVTHKKKKTRK
jgi:hypothetical protein